MKIEIELIESDLTNEMLGGWKVTCGDRYAHGLAYDEMLGLFAAITMPKHRPTLQWLKTSEEHQQWFRRLECIKQSNVDYEEVTNN